MPVTVIPFHAVAEALRVLSEIVRVLRPDPPSVTFANETHVPGLYAVVERRLQAQDQDQEVGVAADDQPLRSAVLLHCQLGP